uniref:Helicase Sen1 N-terminal domain-containing protein n=1 Tax=Peronospora matthiolae TaxID=2874970 RepID=A0AAV1U4Z0_9STRA
MEAQARALEEEVQQLGAQEPTKHTAVMKQRLYTRVGQFLMGSLNMQHWWCDHSSLMVFMMRVLELYPASESVCAFYKKMEQQLRHCCRCVDTYHAALPSVRVELEFEFTPESIASFFVKSQALDADRVQRQLADAFTGLVKASPEKLEIMANTLYEVLHHRRLLSDFRIVRVLSRWVCSPFADVKANSYLGSLRGCAGLYQLLVSPYSALREWAQNMVQHFGSIQLRGDRVEDRYLLEVLDEWMYVLENEAFNKSMLLLDFKTKEEIQDFLEPTNCVKTPTKPMLWSALDTVMQQMDLDSLEAMLVSFDTIPDVVFNYLQDADPAGDQTLTLVVSKCFAVLLRCLGHRFWDHSVNSPKVVLDVIMQHCRLTSWRVYVTKQFIELLPPLLATIRPSQIVSQSVRIALSLTCFLH